MSGWNTNPSANTFQGVKLQQTTSKSRRSKPSGGSSARKSTTSAPGSVTKKGTSKAPFLIISAIILVMALVIYILQEFSIEEQE